MIGNEPQVGDRVHQEGRTHPTRTKWSQANGEITSIIYDDDGEPLEVWVEFNPYNIEFYAVEELEWTSMIGGFWWVA